MSWKIDSAHSEVAFSVRHMMISKTRGSFEQFSGEVNFDEANPAASTVDIRIKTGSINTRDEKRDGHLKSADFFDVENYPVMSFVSKRVEVANDTSGKLIGDLTIKDVTKEVALDVIYSGQAKSPWGSTSAGFSGSTTINRTHFGLTWNAPLETGGILVGEHVTISIELEIVKEQEEAAAA